MSSKTSTIASPENPKMKRLRKLQQRPDSRAWIIEGAKLLREALSSEIRLREVYLTKEAAQEKAIAALITRAGCPIFVIPQNLMKKISSLENPPGVLAVGEALPGPVDPSPGRLGACLLSIHDTGNFGTIVRTAEAVGCDRVAYTSDCVNPHQTKVVRASMGSIFRVPLVEISDVNSALETLMRKGVSLYALDAGSTRNLFDVAPQMPTMILVGSEAQGLPLDLPAGILRISIPMQGKVESLNAAMAAAVALYHFARHLPQQ